METEKLPPGRNTGYTEIDIAEGQSPATMEREVRLTVDLTDTKEIANDRYNIMARAVTRSVRVARRGA